MSDVEILGGTVNRPETSNVTKDNPVSAPNPMSVMAKIQNRQKTLTLSPEGKAYCNELKQLAEEANEKFTFTPFRSGGIDTLLLVDGTGRFGVVLGFAESASKVGDQPCVLHTDAAIQHLKSKGVSVLNTLIIGREDYNRASIAFQNICDLINAFSGVESSTLTLADFAGCEILMSTNPQEVAEYLERNSPHSVPPRQDVGAVFKILSPGDKPEEALPLAAMTGYTTFLQESSPGVYGGAVGPIFTPLFHMEFHSTIADPAILSLLLISAYEFYCYKFGWINQFDTFKVGEVNIGNLIPDENNSPWFCPDRSKRDAFIKQYVPKPAVAVLDCMTGRYQLPLAYMLKDNPETANKFRERIARFLNVPNDPSHVPNVTIPTVSPIFEYTGIIKQEIPFDSNIIDYLYLVNKGVTNMGDLEPWLNYYPDPTIKTKFFANWYPHNWEARYQNNIKVINPTFLNMVSEYLHRAGVKINFETRQYQQFGIGILNDQAILNSAQQVHIQPTQKVSGYGRGYSLFDV